MIPDSEIFMDMLKNKEHVISSILKDIDVCEKNMVSFEKLESLYNQNKSVDINKAMKACSTSLRHSNDINRKILMMLLVYASGDSFTSDSGKVLIKMGRGEDALREMLKQKINGR